MPEDPTSAAPLEGLEDVDLDELDLDGLDLADIPELGGASSDASAVTSPAFPSGPNVAADARPRPEGRPGRRRRAAGWVLLASGLILAAPAGVASALLAPMLAARALAVGSALVTLDTLALGVFAFGILLVFVGIALLASGLRAGRRRRKPEALPDEPKLMPASS